MERRKNGVFLRYRRTYVLYKHTVFWFFIYRLKTKCKGFLQSIDTWIVYTKGEIQSKQIFCNPVFAIFSC